ncbi:MAG: hypothetical protein HYY06_29740 [Deltaproteobacteria bacterium]|nr:hypothetical protein [Deltaproteobacteria bacterium]
MEWQFDKRVLDRNVQKGVVSAKDVEKRLKGLPDLQDQILVETEEERASEQGAPEKE